MERAPIALVGCGGMGRRHLTGVAALYRSDFRNIDLAAVCDLNKQNAEDLADEAAEQLGTRPRVFTDLAEMVRAMPEIQGVDVVTDVAGHVKVATACFELGLHVQCEKPMAITRATSISRMRSTSGRLGRVPVTPPLPHRPATSSWKPPQVGLHQLPCDRGGARRA